MQDVLILRKPRSVDAIPDMTHGLAGLLATAILLSKDSNSYSDSLELAGFVDERMTLALLQAPSYQVFSTNGAVDALSL
jgi:hypothetical protein